MRGDWGSSSGLIVNGTGCGSLGVRLAFEDLGGPESHHGGPAPASRIRAGVSTVMKSRFQPTRY